jgi:hypothetical protein
MHGGFKRGLLGMALVAALSVAPAVMSATSAGAWFTGTQGCTPGYWKNHTDAWADTPYSPTDTVGSVFTIPADFSSFSSETLLDALNGAGGTDLNGAVEILLRAGVAGLLNASDPNVDYQGSVKLIIKHVDEALASEKRGVIINTAARIDARNNGTGGCPLS